MKKIILFLVCVFFVQNANALCMRMPVQVKIVTKPGKVIYDDKHSRNEFARLSHSKVSPNTLGLTVTNLDVSMSGTAKANMLDGRSFCVGVDSVTFEIGYDDIKVYIDKKYPKNSCNYKVILDHENYHVGVAQQALTFFKPDIERVLRKAVQDLRPENVYTRAGGNDVMQRQFAQIRKKVQPLLDHINNKIAEKNFEIDTPESYAASTKLCPKW